MSLKNAAFIPLSDQHSEVPYGHMLDTAVSGIALEEMVTAPVMARASPCCQLGSTLQDVLAHVHNAQGNTKRDHDDQGEGKA